MTDHAIAASDPLVPDLPAGHRIPVPDSPWVVFPSLVLLLIMPLGIVLHPVWLPFLAEFGTVVMFCVIFRLSRL